MDAEANQVIRLTLLARLDLLPGATALVREVTRKLGLDDRDSRRFELVVEEACVNVIEHAFEGEIKSFDIVIERRPGQVVVGVEDQGLPFDYKKYESGQESGLGIILMKAFADEVHFLNLGRRGKRVELVKNLPEKGISSVIQETLDAVSKESVKAIDEKDVTIRLMRPDEAPGLARCAYRCYGYTYSTDNFYFPERVHELVESGLMVSVVAITHGGDIVGHLSVTKESPQSLVGESGQAIVDPRCRGNGIHKKMGFFLQAQNKAAGMYGSYGEAVTVHTYSQRSALSRGYTETGLLLGFTPATMYFKDIQKEENEKRRPAVLLYLRLNEEPLREVYPPTHHTGIITRIYEHSGLRRKITTSGNLELPEHSQINVKVQTEASRAFLRVVEYGQDLEELVKFRLKEICTKRIDCIYLDLPLSHPAVQRYSAAMELLGFFFGGVLPELHDGDILRLQYINNAQLELENVQLATEFSKELYKYVLNTSGLAQ